MIDRRDFLRGCCASTVAAKVGLGWKVAQCQEPTTNDSVTENQRGDPDVPDEYVTFSPSAIRNVATNSRKATFEEWDANLPFSMISTARAFIGSSRKNNPQQIMKFLELFDLPFATEKGNVPFCAAGLSYCGLVAYVNRLARVGPTSLASITKEKLRRLMPDLEHYYFYPTVSCVDMYHMPQGNENGSRMGQV